MDFEGIAKLEDLQIGLSMIRRHFHQGVDEIEVLELQIAQLRETFQRELEEMSQTEEKKFKKLEEAV